MPSSSLFHGVRRSIKIDLACQSRSLLRDTHAHTLCGRGRETRLVYETSLPVHVTLLLAEKY